MDHVGLFEIDYIEVNVVEPGALEIARVDNAGVAKHEQRSTTQRTLKVLAI